MALPIDLKTFAPKSADNLFSGLVEQAAGAAADSWREMREIVTQALQGLAVNAYATQERLRRNEISQAEADFLVHMQELYLNQVMLQARFQSYVAAQSVLNAVTALVAAAIKNLTGVSLSFG